jgi:hypothetical protein
METLEPWVYGPLELIKHAEEHQQANGDFDRRMALIGYDNAIEISIRTYLQLHPTQRRGAEYSKEQVNKWLTNYHSLLDFFFDEFMKASGQAAPIAKKTFIHYHDLRNNLYHEGKNFVPPERDVQGARSAALYIFSTLFHIKGEELLKGSPTLHTPTARKFTFQGKGNDIFKFPLKVGPAIFRITYKGKDSHTCVLCDENNYQVAQLISAFEGLYSSNRTSVQKYNKTTNIKKEGIYVLKVNATSGTWEIEVE